LPSRTPEQKNGVAAGVYVAAVTPRRSGSQEIDLGATWELIDFLCSHNVSGIVFMGSTGEFVNFGIEERIRLISLAVKRSRVPIWINVSHSTLDGAVELAEAASESGAAGLLLMPPYYFRYRGEEILMFYRKYAANARVKAPTLLYHIPVFNNGIPLEVAAELLKDGAFAGIKDSSGDWETFAALKRLYDKGPFSLMIGDDNLFARARAEGAPGGISGVASACPELLVALDKAVAAGNAEQVARLDARLREFIGWLGFFPVPVGVKEAAALRGIKCTVHAVPLSPAQKTKRSEFREWFESWLPAVQRECKDQ
jgi:4-hydroxy-tetrahydrodipicolinate synthase